LSRLSSRCADCSFPAEYCEFSREFPACRPWLLANYPDLYPFLHDDAAVAALAAKLSKTALPKEAPEEVEGGEEGEDGEGEEGEEGEDGEEEEGEKKAAAGGGGGAGAGGAGGGITAGAPKIFVLLRDRGKQAGKKKVATGVVGLDKFGIKAKDAASVLGKAHGSGATVTKSDAGAVEVQIQGNFLEEIATTLVDQLDAPRDKIWVIREGKAKRAFADDDDE
jgi:density-regulated protein